MSLVLVRWDWGAGQVTVDFSQLTGTVPLTHIYCRAVPQDVLRVCALCSSVTPLRSSVLSRLGVLGLVTLGWRVH